ncbi:MAG: hypothetical protein LH472_06925 [Pyrinomonadaceae bacterium]|nr:hypothetical protein [Pyrinomonadaceae bacterium]
MKRVLLFSVFLIFSAGVFAQTPSANFDLTNYGVKIEPDRRLIIVMASLEAAGLDTPLTADGAKFRQKLKTDLQSVSPELRQKLVVFIEQYKRRHPQATNAEIVSPFISMAYTLSPAPDFSDPRRATDLPGDLLEVLDFAPLVRELYRRVLSAKLDEYVKDYQTAGDAMRPSTIKMVGDLLDYLHTRPELYYIDRIKTQVKDSKGKKNLEKTELRERQRRFYIVPEMLAPKETINFRNIGDDYFAIVPPATNLSVSEVRRAYLQFVVDPLVLRSGKDISTVRDSIKVLLDERRKSNPDISPDVFLTVSRSLVAAIDARQIEFEKTRIATAQARRKIDQMKTEKDKLAVSDELKKFKTALANETALQLSEAYEKGSVLSFYFADQLKGLVDSGFDIAGSLRDFILALDATKETNRLAQFAEAKKSALAAREERRKNSGNQEIVIDNPVTKKLLEIDQITKTKNYAEAEKKLVQLVGEYPNEARVYYSMGRIASLSAEGIADETERNKLLVKAKKAYENAVLTTQKYPDPTTRRPDAALMSLSFVALARIYEFAGDASYAIKIYEAAVAVGNVPDGAYTEAVAALERLLKEQ